MADHPPSVYIFNGEDEFTITGFVAALQAKMGDPTMAEMNISRLDGRTISLDELTYTVSAMPFLLARRLVIVTNPLAKLISPTLRKKFTDLLDKIPPSTALVLVEYRLLTEEKDRKRDNLHWLEKWAASAGSRVLVKNFSLPHGKDMEKWIQERVRHFGGQFTPHAAATLANLIGDEPRLADQEIKKLLTYVNYARLVEADDVENLTPSVRQGNIFNMVDALANQDSKQAQEILHRLLYEQDALSIMGMIVRQFRLLLQAREVLDMGGREADIARELKIQPFVAGKLTPQARRFTLPVLEEVYRRLLDVDEAIKTSQMEEVVALDTLIVQLTN